MWTTDHTRLAEIGPIVAARVVQAKDQITLMTSNGLVLRTAVYGIRLTGRNSRGVRIVNLQEGDNVSAVTVLTYEDLTRRVDGGTQDETLAALGMAGPGDLELVTNDPDEPDALLDELDNGDEELIVADDESEEPALSV